MQKFIFILHHAYLKQFLCDIHEFFKVTHKRLPKLYKLYKFQYHKQANETGVNRNIAETVNPK